MPSCVLKKALERLSSATNGFSHPSDLELAKTYILALYQFEPTLDAALIKGYLVSQLGWDSNDANLIVGFINTLNSGKSLHGAKKDKVSYFYKQWESECK
jgi:hypothetical protein